MPDALEDNSILTRYLFSKSEINYGVKKIATSALTSKHPKGFSVFDTTGDNAAAVLVTAETHVIPHRTDGKSLLGWFHLEKRHYSQANLNVVRDYPPPKHYNIFGMPVGAGLEEAKKTSLRQQMVAASDLHLLDPLFFYGRESP